VEERFQMNKNDVIAALKQAKESSNKRNFSQTVDLIITLKDLDLKKPENQVDFFLPLHHSNGRQTKVCGLVGPEMKEVSEKDLDFSIVSDDFAAYAKDKKKVKKLAEGYDFFIAQANLMGAVAQTFGRVFGPRNKMPNPKSGCVVPPSANLSQLKARLQNTVRIQIKTAKQLQVAIGKEDMDEAKLVENAITIYDQLVHHLPNEIHNIKCAFLKLTMGPSVKVGGAAEEEVEENPEDKK